MSKLKVALGFILSLLFLLLAFRSVDLIQMIQVLKKGHYFYVVPSVAVLFLGHYLRSLRWRYFLDPIQPTNGKGLFSSLIIGYMANTVTPAHLGEFLRSFVLSRKQGIAMESVFATIVVERIVDVVSLVLLMLLVISVHPFPPWAVRSGYVILAAVLGASIFLILSKQFFRTLSSFVCHVLPGALGERLTCSIDKFLSGIIPLKRKRDYVPVFIYTLAIWLCYALCYYFALSIFNLSSVYGMPWFASLVILVITTISIVVPSSPGYVGTFHFLCQSSLMLFGVPAEVSLSYATIAHGINVLPVMALGFVLSAWEGVRIGKHDEEARVDVTKVPL